MSFPSNPNHNQTRDLLRVAGPILCVVGAIFALIGIGNFFISFGSGAMPQYFWCAFVGLPLIGIGAGLTQFAYVGAVSRYMASEVAPVGKDVVNYMAHETKGAVREVAAAVTEGFRSGAGMAGPLPVDCPGCRTPNAPEARFCKQCGMGLFDKVLCSNCGKACECGSKFCIDCGKAVA